MKKAKRQAAGAELILLLKLNADATALGVADGYQFISGADNKRTSPGRDPFSLLLLDDGCGACACRITVPRPYREWETVSRKDYYPLTDALTRRYIAAAEQQTGLQLTTHLTELHVITPPEAAARANAPDEPLAEVYRKLFPAEQEMRISSIYTENGVTRINLQKTDGFSASPFRAGQYVRLTLPAENKRSIELPLCCAPSCAERGVYKVAAIEPPSDLLSDLHEGDALSVSSPFGALFCRPIRDHETIIGMTDRKGLPSFLSMAQTILKDADKHRLTVLYFGTENDCPFMQEFRQIGEQSARVRLIRFPMEEQTDHEKFFRAVLPHEAYTVFISGDDESRALIRAVIAPLRLAANCVKEFPAVLTDGKG